MLDINHAQGSCRDLQMDPTLVHRPVFSTQDIAAGHTVEMLQPDLDLAIGGVCKIMRPDGISIQLVGLKTP